MRQRSVSENRAARFDDRHAGLAQFVLDLLRDRLGRLAARVVRAVRAVDQPHVVAEAPRAEHRRTHAIVARQAGHQDRRAGRDQLGERGVLERVRGELVHDRLALGRHVEELPAGRARDVGLALGTVVSHVHDRGADGPGAFQQPVHEDDQVARHRHGFGWLQHVPLQVDQEECGCHASTLAQMFERSAPFSDHAPTTVSRLGRPFSSSPSSRAFAAYEASSSTVTTASAISSDSAASLARSAGSAATGMPYLRRSSVSIWIAAPAPAISFALCGWSEKSGKKTEGSPADSAPYAVPEPPWLSTAFAAANARSCGTHRSTRVLPGIAPSEAGLSARPVVSST